VSGRRVASYGEPNGDWVADVFISYKREERQAVECLEQELRRLGLDVWFDARLQPGKAFTDEIVEEIDNCRAMLVCWSPSAVASEYVRGEADLGRQRGVLVQATISNCRLVPPFNSLHAVALDDWLAHPIHSHSGWKKILQRIGTLCEREDIASYGALDVEAPAEALRTWIERHKSSPLFMAVDELLQVRDAEEAERTRLQQEARERRAREEAERREREAAARAGAEAELALNVSWPARRRTLRRTPLTLHVKHLWQDVLCGAHDFVRRNQAGVFFTSLGVLMVPLLIAAVALQNALDAGHWQRTQPVESARTETTETEPPEPPPANPTTQPRIETPPVIDEDALARANSRHLQRLLDQAATGVFWRTQSTLILHDAPEASAPVVASIEPDAVLLGYVAWSDMFVAKHDARWIAFWITPRSAPPRWAFARSDYLLRINDETPAVADALHPLVATTPLSRQPTCPIPLGEDDLPTIAVSSGINRSERITLLARVFLDEQAHVTRLAVLYPSAPPRDAGLLESVMRQRIAELRCRPALNDAGHPMPWFLTVRFAFDA
jgi:hypothetical protein